MAAATMDRAELETDLKARIETEEQEAVYQREHDRSEQAFAHEQEVVKHRERLDALKAEAGESTGEMQNERVPEDPLPPEELVLRGSKTAQMRLWAGKAPGSVTIKLKGLSLKVDGSFDKGERVKFSGEALIVGEAGVDKLDKHTKAVVECEEVLSATIVDLEVE